MHVWKCSVAPCPVVAMGTGKPTGLLAVGWHVTEEHLLCPSHHPSGQGVVDARARVFQEEALAGDPVNVARFLDAARGPLIFVTVEDGVASSDVAQMIMGLRGVASAVDASSEWRGSWPLSAAGLERLRASTLGAVMAGWRVMYRLVPLVWEGGHHKLFEYPVKSPSLDVYDSLSALFREAKERLPREGA